MGIIRSLLKVFNKSKTHMSISDINTILIGSSNTPDEESIRLSIDNSSFVWRTLSGIQEETNFETKKIEKLLGQMILQGKVITTVSSQDGVVLFTTPDHYKKNMPFLKKFLDSSTGSVSA